MNTHKSRHKSSNSPYKSRADAAKEQRVSDARVQASLLPEIEWDLLKGRRLDPVEWNTWLNYEYARSYRPIVDDVLKLRSRPRVEREAGQLPNEPGVHHFALFLFQKFPDFPKLSWTETRSDIRQIALASVDAQHPFPETGLRAYDTQDWVLLVQLGDLSYGMEGEYADWIGIFEFNFQRPTAKIVKSFADWLKKRKEFLKEKYRKLDKVGLSPTLRATLFEETENRANTGKADNWNAFQTKLKQLGALRLMNHYNNDFDAAWSCSICNETATRKPLYDREKSTWRRASLCAGEFLRRFSFRWPRIYGPSFIIKPEKFIHSVGPGMSFLCRPLPSDLKDIRDQGSIEQFLDSRFVSYRERQNLLGNQLSSDEKKE